MNLIDYTDKAIMKMLLSHAKQMNPWLRIGEVLDGPVAKVAGGKIFQEVVADAQPTNLIKLKTIPPNILSQQPPQNVTAVTTVTVSLKLQDIADFRVGGLTKLDFKLRAPTFLYPYRLDIPAREWLEDYNVGDIVSVAVIDPNTFASNYVQTVLTQQMIDDNSDVIFRFALSD